MLRSVLHIFYIFSTFMILIDRFFLVKKAYILHLIYSPPENRIQSILERVAVGVVVVVPAPSFVVRLLTELAI